MLEIAVPQYLEQFILTLADSIHALPGSKRLVVVIPPFTPGFPSAEILFNPNVHVDFFALMTYDANIASQTGAPNAPIEWVEEQINHYVGNKDPTARKKLLVGLNMYGALFKGREGRRPILGREYVELLETYEPTLDWDSENEESFFEFSDGGDDWEVWYPTLMSIKKRLTLVEDFDVGGVCFWELGQGLDYFYELI